MLSSSIRHNLSRDVLPDFRNQGVIARILVAVNLLAAGAALGAEQTWSLSAERFVRVAALLEPLLIASVVLFYLASPMLARLPYLRGCAAVLAIELALTAAGYAWAVEAGAVPSFEGLARVLLLAALVTVALLGYFRLLVKAYSPALAEARLQALQARIRPHFLFNSLNAVLSLIRRDARGAERALQDLADLYRVLMADSRKFVRLADEIALLERYASLEQLRLGERLRLTWELDSAPMDALLPPLILQPLLENAIYHGVAPGTGPGEVVVQVARRGDRVRACIENPYLPEHAQRAGNRMALENIRERLMLFFDAEGRIETRVRGNRYQVELEIPYRTEAASRPRGSR
jgi:two-component system sensor histidine kinase AlgZ